MEQQEHPLTRVLPTFDEAVPLGASDAAFIEEARRLFTRYGNAERFGLCLLHDHFPLGEGEILFETHDKLERTLSVATVRRDTIPNMKETMWRLAPAVEALQGCAEDKCKSYEALQGCAEDKCK